MTDRTMQMPEARVEEFRSGWPKDELLPDEGAVRITGDYTDPRLVDRACRNGFILALIVSAFAWFIVQEWSSYFLFLLLGSLPLFFVSIAFFYRTGKSSLGVKISAGEIRLAGKTYSRAAPIEFRVERHHKAIAEQHREMNTGQRTSSTYRQAIEVVMQYGENRVVIAEMREKDSEMARALVIRLQNWCDRFDQMLIQLADQKDAGGPPRAEADDFGPAPPIR
ncbi:MAG: hypothetical protein ACRED5_03795 [Propylenella sp.]